MNSIRESIRIGFEDGGNIVPQFVEYRESDIMEIRRGEILRYSGIPADILRKDGLGRFDVSYLDTEVDSDADDKALSDSRGELVRIMDDVLKLADRKFTYRVAYCVTPIEWENEVAHLPISKDSLDLSRNLEGCSHALIFAATVGSGIDLRIRRYERTDSIRGLLLQGLGAEKAEALCDTFCRDINKAAATEGMDIKPRYSPGYGDLPITVQPDVLRLVNAEKRLGITLNASYLMSPSKSVTAIVGLRISE